MTSLQCPLNQYDCTFNSVTSSKLCSRCRKNLDLNQFAKNKAEKDGLQRWCRKCRSLHALTTKKHRRNHRLNRTYGLSLDAYREMLCEQGGKCACCHSADPGGHGEFHVDHCHETGKIRGLLCSKCNTGIGLLGDNLNSLLKAVHYLAIAHS
jgi:hypothetical protein